MRLTPIMYSLEMNDDPLAILKLGVDIIHIDLDKVSRPSAIEFLATVRESENKGNGKATAIALELQSRAPTTGLLEQSGDQECILSTGSMVVVTSDEQYANKCNTETIYINHPYLSDIKPQMKLYFETRNIILECVCTKMSYVVCKIEKGGKMFSFMDVTIPGLRTTSPVFTERDIADVKMAFNTEVDILIVQNVSLSKIETINENARERRYPLLFARVSILEDMKELYEIIKMVDGIVLSPEAMLPDLKAANMCINLKKIVRKCQKRGKHVIFIANNTSGVYNSAGTTFCTSAIHHAITSGVDCIAITPNPTFEIEATIKFLNNVCETAEQDYIQNERELIAPVNGFKVTTAVLAEYVRFVAHYTQSVCVIQANYCKQTARALSLAGLNCPVIVPTENMFNARRLQVCKGIIPVCTVGVKESLCDTYLIKFAHTCGLLEENKSVFLLVSESDATDSVNQVAIMQYDKELSQLVNELHKD